MQDNALYKIRPIKWKWRSGLMIFEPSSFVGFYIDVDPVLVLPVYVWYEIGKGPTKMQKEANFETVEECKDWAEREYKKILSKFLTKVK